MREARRRTPPPADWQHPDLRHVTLPEGKQQIAVDQIRALCADLSMTAHAAGYKVALIHPADKMNAHAANSLLKTLEEPPPHVVFIFATTEPHKVPETIQSRCQRFDFRRALREPTRDILVFERDRRIAEQSTLIAVALLG